MKEEFEEQIEGRTYVFKRMYHPELELTYHIHHKIRMRLIIFRIRKQIDKWTVLLQDQLPDYIYKVENQFGEIIERNEYT